MLEARPEVHGDGSQLNFDRHHLLGIEEVHGNANDHVQAAVPVGLGVGDIVLDRDDFQVVLTLQQVEQVVHVADIGANHADARDVHDVLLDVLERALLAVAADLLDNALGGLHTRLDMMDRRAVFAQVQVLVENLKADDHLAQRGAVTLAQFAKLRPRLAHELDVLIRHVLANSKRPRVPMVLLAQKLRGARHLISPSLRPRARFAPRSRNLAYVSPVRRLFPPLPPNVRGTSRSRREGRFRRRSPCACPR